MTAPDPTFSEPEIVDLEAHEHGGERVWERPGAARGWLDRVRNSVRARFTALRDPRRTSRWKLYAFAIFGLVALAFVALFALLVFVITLPFAILGALLGGRSRQGPSDGPPGGFSVRVIRRP